MVFAGRQRRISVNRQFTPYSGFVRQFIVNLSRDGAFIMNNDSDSDLPEAGTQVSLKHTVVTDRIETIEGQARVVRVSEAPRGVGVVFEQLTPESVSTIEELLDPRTVRPVGGSDMDLRALRRLAFRA